MDKVVSIILIVFVLWLLLKILSAPVRLAFKLILNAVIGLVILFAVNLAGSVFGFHLPVTPIRCLVAGILGIPGTVLLILIELFL